jgi:nucleotide-binding universal stress UspA family protein
MPTQEHNERVANVSDPIGLDNLTTAPVIVGVDGSDRGYSAVRWAASEAARDGRPLVLILAAETEPAVPHFSAASHERLAQGAMDSARQQVETLDANVEVVTRVVTGPPADVLVEGSHHADITVLGRRGRGTFARLLVGSTSVAVAGRAVGPVVIVPDDWRAPRHRPPILVGVDIAEPDRAALEFAHRRAAALGVDLIAVTATEAPWSLSYDPLQAMEAVDDWITNETKLLTDVLRPHAVDYPEVVTQLKARRAHPAQAVIDEAHVARAQLVVLGARRQRRLSGFPLGSVTRAVLHHADCPVAVVRMKDDQAGA